MKVDDFFKMRAYAVSIDGQFCAFLIPEHRISSAYDPDHGLMPDDIFLITPAYRKVRNAICDYILEKGLNL